MLPVAMQAYIVAARPSMGCCTAVLAAGGYVRIAAHLRDAKALRELLMGAVHWRTAFRCSAHISTKSQVRHIHLPPDAMVPMLEQWDGKRLGQEEDSCLFTMWDEKARRPLHSPCIRMWRKEAPSGRNAASSLVAFQVISL